MKEFGIAIALAVAVGAKIAPAQRAVASAFAEPLSAQEPPIFQSTAMPNGDGMATIRNAGRVPLTAYFFEVLCEPCNPIEAGQHTYRGYDAVTAQGGQPVRPSASRTEMLGACHCNKAGISSPARAVLKAALFADGTTYGEPQWAKKLIQHRAQSRRAIESAINALSGNTGNVTREEYLARLNQARDSTALRESFPTVQFPDFDPFAFAASRLATADRGRLRNTVESLLAALRLVRSGNSPSGAQ